MKSKHRNEIFIQLLIYSLNNIQAMLNQQSSFYCYLNHCVCLELQYTMYIIHLKGLKSKCMQKWIDFLQNVATVNLILYLNVHKLIVCLT